MRLPADNALSAFCPGDPFPAGTSPPSPGAYADGVYIMLAPLAAGVHHISFAGAESGTPVTLLSLVKLNLDGVQTAGRTMMSHPVSRTSSYQATRCDRIRTRGRRVTGKSVSKTTVKG